jgi:hypothetical protein
MRWLRDWWRRQVFWHRFIHGRCTRCGTRKPLTGMTWCQPCFEAEREARYEKK